MLKAAILICLLASFAGAEGEENAQDPSKFMYVILRNKVPVCVGASIEADAKKIIIATAAHCAYRVEPAALGVLKVTAAANVIAPMVVDRVFIHPYYMPPLVDYDIALLKLFKAEKTYKNTSLENLEITKTEPTSQSKNILLLHWNWKAESQNPNKTISAAVEDRKSCRPKLAGHVTVSSKMLCINFESAVVPDGSPLLVDNKVAGIASYGLKGNLPKIFTNIANEEILNFILNYL